MVNETLASFLSHDMPEVIDNGIDPTFNGAFGAAELVKRQPYYDDRLASLHQDEDL